jgi:hypothetical protein
MIPYHRPRSTTRFGHVGIHHQLGLRPILQEISRRLGEAPEPVDLTTARLPPKSDPVDMRRPRAGLSAHLPFLALRLKWRPQVAAAIAKILSRASGTDVDVETLKTIVIFCGVGLVVSLLLAGGIDSLRLAPDAHGLDDIMAWI